MKRVYVLFIFLMVVFSGIVFAQEPSTGVEEGDAEKILDAVSDLPIDPETGKFKFDKTKAELRVETINKYVGPFTNVLFGVELTLSWIFVFSFIVWILLIEIIVMPASEIFGFNIWGSLLAATAIGSLAMQGFGEDLAIWMNSIATSWWAGTVALVTAFGFFMGYLLVMRMMKKWKKNSKKEKLKRADELRLASGASAKRELETRGSSK